jgi:hypothetical protein
MPQSSKEQKEPFDMPSSLMLETIRLLKNTNKKLFTISLDTRIPFHWLNKFRDGVYINPSVNRVQYLYEYLTNTKIV